MCSRDFVRDVRLLRLRLELTLFVGELTEDDTARMSWKQYESRVVDKHSVELVGYPFTTIRDLSGLSLQDLTTIQTALEEGHCKWARLSSAELNARKAARDPVVDVVDDASDRAGDDDDVESDKEPVPAPAPVKKRKERSDKGKKRGPRGSNKENEPAAKRARVDMEEGGEEQ